MNKRQLKKYNKKIIDNILKNIPFDVIDKRFGDGYICYREPAIICWFWLKQFPDWKFGIWLNTKNKSEYDIFGQAKVLIDKFKPVKSDLSEIDVDKFNSQLLEIQNKSENWIEYLGRIEIQKTKNKIKYDYNIKRKESILSILKKIETKDFYFKLEDHRNQVYRYVIALYTRKNEYEPKIEEIKECYKEICKAIYSDKEVENEWESYSNNFHLEYLELDEYYFEYLDEIVTSPREYNSNAKKYNWKIKTFDEMVESI